MTVSHIALGNQALKAKKYERALSHYRQAQKIHPQLAHVLHANIALAERRLLETVSSEQTAEPVATAIDIVVPVYNALEDVQRCLASLERHTDGFNVRIIVVNDGSDVATSQWLRDHCAGKPLFILLEHPANQGYTKAVNTGLKASTAPYVITQNSDTIAAAGWLRGLVRCMESDPKLGIVGPLSNAASWQNVPLLKDESGTFAVNELPQGLDVDDMAKLVADVSARRYPRLPFVNGFCFMIHRAVVDAIGYMDEENFPVGYGEENDYCIRATDAGFELAIADDVYVYHAKSKSFGHQKRVELSKAGTEALKRKHTAERYFSLVRMTANVGQLNEIRAEILSALNQPASTRERPHSENGAAKTSKEGLSIRVNEVDINGNAISLYPKPEYASKEYEVTQPHGRACISLPFGNGQEPQSIDKPKRNIGVHLHLYYTEFVDEFCGYLNSIEQEFSLYVSVVDESSIGAVQRKFAEELPQAKTIVKCFPNRGRDIAPFLVGFRKEMQRHDIIAHIHSKKSVHNRNKSDWRRQLMHCLMGSRTIVNSVLDVLSSNPHLGMLFPEYHYSLRGQISWGTNFQVCRTLAERMGIRIEEGAMTLFPAGSMFWARTASLLPLLSLSWRWDDFPPESGQVDGTPAHAVERLFGEVVRSCQADIMQIRVDKPFNLTSYHTARWPCSLGQPPEEIKRMIEAYRAQKPRRKARYAVYAALTGGYEQPVVHESLSNECDYLLFADRPVNDRGMWEVKAISYKSDQSVRVARHVKVNPHRYLNGYDVVVWVDANVIIRGDVLNYIKMALEHPNIPLFGIRHPQRNCIYEEARAVVQANKDSEAKVQQQMRRYESEGYPRNLGLIETNLLVINLQHPLSEKLFQAWSAEIEQGSHRDQLSLNYCIWKVGVQWKPIFEENLSLRDSKDFAYLGHGRNSGYVAPLLGEIDKITAPQ